MVFRVVSRLLLAAPAVLGGVDALRHPDDHAQSVAPVVGRCAARMGQPEPSAANLALVARVHGGVTIATASLLALGRAPRITALALAALTAPMVAMNAPGCSASQASSDTSKTAFVTQLAVLGGLLAVAADSRGKPSLRWRVAQARKDRAEAKAAATLER